MVSDSQSGKVENGDRQRELEIRVPCPSGKKRFATFLSAQAVLKRTLAIGPTIHNWRRKRDRTLEIFHCHLCGFFHLGHGK